LLRAVRFATQLGFTIEPATYKAITVHADKIRCISGERICMELEGLLTVPGRAQGVRCLVDTGLAWHIFPGVSKGQMDQGVAVLERLRKRTNFPLVLAGLCVGYDTSQVHQALKVLKLSRHQSRHVRFLLDKRDYLVDATLSVAQLKLLLAEPFFWDLYELQRALLKAQHHSVGPLIRLRRRIRELGDIDYKPRPILNGHDLIRLGARPGPRLGQLLEELYIAQLEGQVHTKAQAETWAQEWFGRHNLDE
jgi:tRNA nucleotidyltransferase/poly(A) polymerase